MRSKALHIARSTIYILSLDVFTSEDNTIIQRFQPVPVPASFQPARGFVWDFSSARTVTTWCVLLDNKLTHAWASHYLVLFTFDVSVGVTKYQWVSDFGSVLDHDVMYYIIHFICGAPLLLAHLFLGCIPQNLTSFSSCWLTDEYFCIFTDVYILSKIELQFLNAWVPSHWPPPSSTTLPWILKDWGSPRFREHLSWALWLAACTHSEFHKPHNVWSLVLFL